MAKRSEGDDEHNRRRLAASKSAARAALEEYSWFRGIGKAESGRMLVLVALGHEADARRTLEALDIDADVRGMKAIKKRVSGRRALSAEVVARLRRAASRPA